MSRFMQGAEQTPTQMMFFQPCRNPNVADRKLCLERMMGFVLPTTFKVKAKLLDNLQCKGKLRRLGKILTQTCIVGNRLLGNRTHDRQELLTQLREDGTHGCNS